MRESIFKERRVGKDRRGAGVPIVFNFPELQSAKKREKTKIIPVTPREKEVLYWLHQGKSSWAIAQILGLRERTVNFHIYKIMEKLEAVNRPQMVTIALSLGFIDLK